MKKLMMAAAIVCAAVGVQAATIDWKVSGASADLGARIYLLTAIDTTEGAYESESDFAAAAVASATITKFGSGSRATYATGDQSATATAITSSANYYLAIVSGEDAKSAHFVNYTTDAQSLVYSGTEQSKGFLTSTAGTLASGTEVKFSPEPTSGLLLLIGMGALALRRRRA